jgi:hypothetical protein
MVRRSPMPMALLLPMLAFAADQPLLGKSLDVTSPPTGNAGIRKVVARALEHAIDATLSGDPTIPVNSTGGMLQIFLEGATPSAQTFTLPQGIARSGRPFWRAVAPAGFEYVDRYREHGPVAKLRLRREENDPEDDVARDQGVTQLSTFIQTHSAGRPVIVGGDFNLHTDVEPDQSQFLRLLAETGLQDVCATLSCPEPGRIDKFLFRSNAAVTITPLSWHFETDVFVRDGNVPLSDHEALAVRFGWSVAGS